MGVSHCKGGHMAKVRSPGRWPGITTGVSHECEIAVLDCMRVLYIQALSIFATDNCKKVVFFLKLYENQFSCLFNFLIIF